MSKVVLLLALMVLGGCSLVSVSADNPGYASFDLAGVPSSDGRHSFSLGSGSLGLIRWAVDDDDEFAGVDGIRIKVYEGEANDSAMGKQLRKNIRTMIASGWQALVKVHDEGEWMHLLVKLDHDTIVGIVVISVDDSDIVFVNIVGELKPESIPGLLDDIDAPIPKVGKSVGI